MGCSQSSQASNIDDTDLNDTPLNKWTNNHVIYWLQTYNDGVLTALIKPFTKQNITGAALPSLTDEVLKTELGIIAYGTRVTFIKARDELLSQQNSNNSSVQPTPETQPLANNSQNQINQSQNQNNNLLNSANNSQTATVTHHQSAVSSVSASSVSSIHHTGEGNNNNNSHQNHQNHPNNHEGQNQSQIQQSQHTKNNSNNSSNNHTTTPNNPNITITAPTNNQNPNTIPINTDNSMIQQQQQAVNYYNEQQPQQGESQQNSEQMQQYNSSMNHLLTTNNLMPSGGSQSEHDFDTQEQYAAISLEDIGGMNMFNDGSNDKTNNRPDIQLDTHMTSIPMTMARPVSIPHSSINNVASIHIGGNNGNQNSNNNNFNINNLNNSITDLNNLNPNNLNPNNLNPNNNGSNPNGDEYDEIPEEVIRQLDGQRGNQQHQQMTRHNQSIPNNNGQNGGRYNSVQLSDMALDDNDLIINNNVPSMQSVVSHTPSNSTHQSSHPDSQVSKVMRVGGTSVVKGGLVEVFLPNQNMWAKAKLQEVTRDQKYQLLLLPQQTPILADPSTVRVISPPVKSDNKLNPEPAMKFDNPTANMTEKEKKVHEFARELWRTLHKIDVKVVPDAKNELIRGFSGKQLVKHNEKHLKDKIKKQEILQRCQDLVTFKYIRLIASAKNKQIKQEKFENSEKFLYQFENEKHRQFIKDEQPDRRAWTRGTKLQINSSTLGGWVEGTIVEVSNRDTLTITYGPSNQQMRKILDRYQDDVKSTEDFVKTRKLWNIDCKVEVFSQGQQIWCPGRIEEVLEKKDGQPYDIFRVFYSSSDDKDYSKYVDRWSDMLREVQTLNETLAKFKKGTRVMVWSNSKESWTEGIVIDVVEAYEVVNVRYADHEKLVPIHSEVIRLLDEHPPKNVPKQQSVVA